MRILIAPDSFKGTLSAAEAAATIADGLRASMPGATTFLLPIADGGEGTLDALLAARDGTREWCRVTGPLGTTVSAAYGLLDDARTAVIEMAQASGLALVPPAARDPLTLTSYGTGELIAAALARGPDRLVVTLGGSATIDGGAGLLQALGARYTYAGAKMPAQHACGGDLGAVRHIDATALTQTLADWGGRIELACDVDNPLLGPAGAVAFFGPQKGATADSAALLEAGLRHFYDLAEALLGRRVRDEAGAGAAGGVGAALMLFCGARVYPGFELVAELTAIADAVSAADVVITGEGRYDRQTARGKAPARVASFARARGKRVIAICGSVESGTGNGPFEQVEACGGLPRDAAEARERLRAAAVRVGARL